MNLAPDTIPAEVAWPLAIVIILVWLWIEAKTGRTERKRAMSEYLAEYVTLDCRDSRHSACATCACGCHAR